MSDAREAAYQKAASEWATATDGMDEVRGIGYRMFDLGHAAASAQLEESAADWAAECAKARMRALDLRAALQRIADSDGFNGGTWTGELQEIARAAIAAADPR